MREGILRVGNVQLESRGAGALSVREIARELGVVSSAIYRHVADRDALLTLLVVDAFDDLGDAVDRALDSVSASGAEPRAALAALARTMREWALAHPQRWALIYGTPIMGYAAPAEQTTVPGTRAMARLAGILAAGSLPSDAVGSASSGLVDELRVSAEELGLAPDPVLLAEGIGTWSSLVGTVSAEVFGQLGTDLARYGAELLDRWIASTSARFELGPAVLR
ncbi:transcriptional regulator, TetR family [Brevibacterium jeotgali]|uniref:Transcriptional regulator, TetR family n=2 Tax=Brevibacterium jeotgali TaxID=1262550 RepID=A0A2H1L5I1_9MICO|nr:TetR family transcriptional regulator [Brevibacterium jeotgali]SMY12168.1 transcriptional regulator, TetR family [Brevibacterium jeotgali]